MKPTKDIMSIRRIDYDWHEFFPKGIYMLLHPSFIKGVASVSNSKGRRELKDLECSINFDARGDCSSWGKGKRVLSVG